VSNWPDLIVVGDVMVDVSVEAGRLATGGDVHGEVRLRPGGAGANAAVWAACHGARVRLYGRVGEDLPGRLLAEAVAARGVEGRLTVDPAARTGAMLVVHQAGERSMVADRGANATLSPDDLPDRLEAGAVLVSGYLLFHPGSEPAARAALERADAPLVAVDAASWPLLEAFGVERFLQATAGANVLLANEREAEVLSQDDRMLLEDRFARVCRKRGAEGAVLASRGKTLSARPDPVARPLDPTGAGDAFDGVLLAALVKGAGDEEALRRACDAGRAVVMNAETWPAIVERGS
jgi:sugar/nucleoside kinase (ribokinase family)